MVQDQQQNCWLGELRTNPGDTDGAQRGFTVSALFSDFEMALPVNCLKDTKGQPLGEGDIVKLPDDFKTRPLIELLATSGSADATIYGLLQKFRLDPCFPAACEAEANAWLDSPGINDRALNDLTHLPFVTIDNADSRDLDQAIHVASDSPANHPDANSNQEARIIVHYALADASYYVRPGSALFKEALKRTVTYYAPDTAVPMLPRQLSENLISLNPDVRRRALVFKMTVNTDGSLGGTQIIRATIHSRAKLSYAGVQEFIDFAREGKQAEHAFAGEVYAESLLLLEQVGQRRISEARRRNVISYDRREAAVSTDESGRFVISQRERYDSERYNEQVSLMCNMEGARLLWEKQNKDPELQSIFRIHSAPLENRLSQLRQDIDNLVRTRNLTAQWRWKADQRLDEYLEFLPQETEYSALRQVIERMILLTNQASLFDDEPGPHHALGVEYYARFSAPMREIVGIFVHKELLETLDLAAASESQIDATLREQIIESSNRSRKLQKKLEKEARLLAIRQYFYQDLALELVERPIRQGVIMGMRGGKIYVSVNGFGADVKLYTDDLSEHFGCRYSVDGVQAGPEQRNSELILDDKSGFQKLPVFVTGDRLTFITKAYDEKRSRFVFVPHIGRADPLK